MIKERLHASSVLSLFPSTNLCIIIYTFNLHLFGPQILPLRCCHCRMLAQQPSPAFLQALLSFSYYNLISTIPIFKIILQLYSNKYAEKYFTFLILSPFMIRLFVASNILGSTHRDGTFKLFRALEQLYSIDSSYNTRRGLVGCFNLL